jgi:transposase
MTDCNDAAGLAQIVRDGWFKAVRIKSRSGYELRALLAAQEVLVRSRVKIEAEIRGPLRNVGVLLGESVGGPFVVSMRLLPPNLRPRRSFAT